MTPYKNKIILNRQFTSVFTNDTNSSLTDLGPSLYPRMDDIAECCKDAIKIMKNLEPHKAAGPDDIPLMLHRAKLSQIAPAITLLFETSLNQGNALSKWRKALVAIIRQSSKSDAINKSIIRVYFQTKCEQSKQININQLSLIIIMHW